MRTGVRNLFRLIPSCPYTLPPITLDKTAADRGTPSEQPGSIREGDPNCHPRQGHGPILEAKGAEAPREALTSLELDGRHSPLTQRAPAPGHVVAEGPRAVVEGVNPHASIATMVRDPTRAHTATPITEVSEVSRGQQSYRR